MLGFQSISIAFSTVLSRTKKSIWRMSAALGVLSLCPLYVAPSFAQSVLVLTTNEDGHTSGNTNSVGGINNMVTEFSRPGIDMTIQRNILTNGTISTETFTNPATDQPYDIVLIGTAYGRITDANFNVLAQAMRTREANAFLMFMDGCPTCAGNLNNLVPRLNELTGLSLGVTGADLTPAQQPFYLNTDSPYQSSFTDLNPLYGFFTRYITNVPADNVLYKRRLSTNNIPPNPTPGTTADAYGVLFPVEQVNGGEGACLFAVDDISIFIDSPDSGWSVNRGRIAPAFLDAVEAGGSCGIPGDISKSFSPTTIPPGGVATLTVHIGNVGAHDLTGVKVIDNLPAPLLVHGGLSAISTTCENGTLNVAADSTSFSLEGATVAPTGCTITVPVRWPSTAASACVEPDNQRTNIIRPGIGFTTNQGQSASIAEATLTCDVNQAPAVATPVPTLSQWALAWLSLGVAALLGARVLRQRKS